ncbi:haloacid dehalogenase-like hydrolase domain-containing 5 [Amphiura filiformis]|uniref:haloacid dehalogenase-like hydrolase domain-containing 5 n=1 Tax=Amphiura filiformis TaxID=82378 RepID=UPI003B21E9B8
MAMPVATIRSLSKRLCPYFRQYQALTTVPRRFKSSKLQPNFGLLLDIDGVVVRGKKVLPQALEAFQMLSDHTGHLRVPTVFVTNAGNKMRQDKAKQLSDWLDIKVSPDQVIMSHSPLRIFPQFHNKHVLVSGQGPVEDIAHMLGFTNITTVDEVRDMFPNLDMVDHKRRPPSTEPRHKGELPKIDAVVLFGEPVRWETSLQLILDVLMTDGYPNSAPNSIAYPHIPVFGCNMDLLWMAEAPLPRLGHGSFLVCLETLYNKITGKDLEYMVLTGKPSQITYHFAENVLAQQAREMGIEGPLRTLYAIGDNPVTDIYGANLYNQYLGQKEVNRLKKSMDRRMKAVQRGSLFEESQLEEESQKVVAGLEQVPIPYEQLEQLSVIMQEKCAEVMESCIVYTGVHSKHSSVQALEGDIEPNILVDHGHRDFESSSELLAPSMEAHHILDAIEQIFIREGFK